jgi:hypothetical protein
MPWFRTLLWIGTISLALVLGVESFRLRSMHVATVEAFEMANHTEAREMVQSWSDASVKHTVITGIKLDYLFIVFYVLLMINCSNHQMNQERNLILNNLLRFNIALAVDTGILDIAENVIMMNNIRSIDDHIPTVLISKLKLIFAGWIIVVWVVSLLKGVIRRRAFA